MRTDWSTTDTVMVPAVRCPECEADLPLIVRTEHIGDGAILRKCVCRRCAAKFRVCIDPHIFPEVLPAAGNGGGVDF